MDKSITWKSFGQNIKSLSYSKLTEDTRFLSMYTTLDKYYKYQSQINHTRADGEVVFDLRPFLYGPEDDYEKPFLLTLVKLLADLNGEEDKNKQKENLPKVYKWFKSNKKLLDISDDLKMENEKKPSSIPSLCYFKRSDCLKTSQSSTSSQIPPRNSISIKIIEKASKQKTNIQCNALLPYIDVGQPAQRERYATAPSMVRNTTNKNYVPEDILCKVIDMNNNVPLQYNYDPHSHDVIYYADKISQNGKFNQYMKSTPNPSTDKRRRSYSSDDVVLKQADIRFSLKDSNKNYNVHKVNNKKSVKLNLSKANNKLGSSRDKSGVQEQKRQICRPKFQTNKKLESKQIDTQTLTSSVVVKNLSQKILLDSKSNEEIAQLLKKEVAKPAVLSIDYIRLTKKLLQYHDGKEEREALKSRSKSLENFDNIKDLPDIKVYLQQQLTDLGTFPMKTEGHEVKLSKRPTSGVTINISSTSTNKLDNIEKQNKYDNIERHKLFGLAVDNLKLSKQNRRSRPSSSLSSLSSRSHSRIANAEFETKDFHHFCVDHECHLDDAMKYQMQINAAINIQRIFRGHVARREIKQLKLSNLQRQKKRQNTAANTERKYLQQLSRLKASMEGREPVFIDEQWDKDYQYRLKQQQDMRDKNLYQQKKKQAKFKAKQNDNLNKKTASLQIHEIFHDNGPTKAQKKAAAIQIQKVVRGWLVRLHMERAKTKIMKRSLNLQSFIHETYTKHLQRIIKRYGGTDDTVVLSYGELLKYVQKRNKFEIEYDRIISTSKELMFPQIKDFFEACGLFPSSKEIFDAVKMILKEKGLTLSNHKFKKDEIVEIAFQIYVPEGTQIKENRKSTWLNPLIDGDEAVSFHGKSKGLDSSYEKCFELIVNSKKIEEL